MKAVIFDIDGTLADLSHRVHHIRNRPANWDKFLSECINDKLIEPIARLANSLYQNEHAILLVSGRSDVVRKETIEWMEKHDISFDDLYMRKAGDYRQDYIIKAEILDEILASGYEIEFVVDDRDQVVDMWRNRGLICLQCREWVDDDVQSKDKGLLTIMIGTSGAGKSTWLRGDDAKSLGIHESHIVSSDQIRADFCGDFKDQSKNDEVFAALHAVVRTRISHGLNTVIDATNLKRKDRLANVALAGGAEVRYVMVERPLTQKLRDADWRKPEVIEKHQNTFNIQHKDILKGDNQPNVKQVIIVLPGEGFMTMDLMGKAA